MMQKRIANAIDSRQFPQWGEYLHGIGWTVEKVGSTQMFIKQLPLFKRSFIKIQHPTGPVDLEEIDKIAKKHKTFFTVIEPHLTHFDQQTYKKFGYKPIKLFYAHSATIKIDLTQSKEQLFKSFSENARRNIKKAQNNNLTIKKIELNKEKSEEAFKTYYSLYQELLKIKKFYAPGYDEYQKKMLAFKNSSFLLFAYEGKTPIACVWYGHYKNVIVYLQTGITKRGYELLANYLLVWEAILIAKKMGIEVFDFESVYDPRYPNESKKWKGYSEFKHRFHGEFVQYPITQIKYYNVFFKFIFSFASLFSR